MQEKFVLKAKTTIKRVAAISAGSLMLSAAAFGAVAASDLSDYPSQFIVDGQWGGLAVVGSNAQAADIVGATDVIARLSQEAVSSVSGTGTTVVSGGVGGKATFGWGIANATITDTIDYELEDDDVSSLIDSSITFQSADYDVREMVKLDQDSPIVHTSLTGSDDDYETTPYMEVARAAMSYYYLFDKQINVTTASTSQPLTMNFLGKTLKITSVDSDGDGFTAYVGDEYFMNVGDSVTVNGKVVTLNNVASCTSSPCNVIVDVDGVQETISGTETVGEIEITVDETFYSDTTAERSGSLIIGEQSSESYQNGDEYVDYCGAKWASTSCKKTDPDWIWVIGGLDANAVGDTSQSSAAPTIGIKNDFVVNGDDDNPVTVGGCYDYPNSFVEVCMDSLTTDDYLDLTIEWIDDLDISNAAGSTVTSEKAIYISSSVEDSLEIESANDNSSVITADTKTDKIWLWMNGTAGNITVLYEDTNNNIVEAGEYNNLTLPSTQTAFARIIYGSTKTTNVELDLLGDAGGDNIINISLDILGDDTANIPETSDDIITNWEVTTNDFVSLGATVGTNAAEEVYWNGSGLSDISTKDENHMSQYGIIILDPKSNGASDEVKLQIPSDQVRANVLVKGTSAKTTTTGGAVQINSIAGVDLIKLDTEVTDKTSKPMIIVGGPCVNPLAAEALGLTFPACGASSTIPTDKALIKLVENAFGGTNVALVVAGWEAANTRDAANVLKKYDDYATQLAGKMEVQVSGTSVTAITAEAEVEAEAPATE